MPWDCDLFTLGPDARTVLQRSGAAMLDSLFGPVARPLNPSDLELWGVMCGNVAPRTAEHATLLAFAQSAQVVLEEQSRFATRVPNPFLTEIEDLICRTSDEVLEAEARLRRRLQQLDDHHVAMASVLSSAKDSTLFSAESLACESADRELHEARALHQRSPDEWPSPLKVLLVAQMKKLGIVSDDSDVCKDLVGAMVSGFIRGRVAKFNCARQRLADARNKYVNATLAIARTEVQAAEIELEHLRGAIASNRENLESCRHALLAVASAREVIHDLLRPAAVSAWTTPLDALGLLALRTGRIAEFHLRLAASQRSVSRLLHFTHIDNVDTIRRYGILAVPELEKRQIKPRFNDSARLDFRLDAVSTSVEFPNYQLFYRFRKQQGTSDREWCVIEVCPSVLWTNECMFSAENAATTSESHLESHLKQGIDGLMRLFDDSGGIRHNVLRAQLRIPLAYPTNPQAEVQVLRGIAPEKIRAFHSVDTSPDFFRPRIDWPVWKAAKNVDGGSTGIDGEVHF